MSERFDEALVLCAAGVVDKESLGGLNAALGDPSLFGGRSRQLRLAVRHCQQYAVHKILLLCRGGIVEEDDLRELKELVGTEYVSHGTSAEEISGFEDRLQLHWARRHLALMRAGITGHEAMLRGLIQTKCVRPDALDLTPAERQALSC
ncbi:MAG: hypothetical protein WC734_02435 [Patescibacteria group bacterium]|jgi:hypothetical protein